MANEIAKKENTALSTEVVGLKHQEVLNSDMPIPRLYLMQKTSDLVDTGDFRAGDFVRSTNNEKLGDSKAPVSFIPLKMTTDWMLQEKVGDRFQWRGREPRTAQNDGLPWEFQKNGTEWKRMKEISVFALLPNDLENQEQRVKEALERGELPEPATPIVLTFRSTSYNAGKEVAKFFLTVEETVKKYGHKLAPSMYALPLSNEKEENDKGSYQVMKVGKPKMLQNNAVVAEAARWYELLTQMDVSALNVDQDEKDDDVAAAHKASAPRAKGQF
jgi:hypothetical protein